MRAIPYKPDNKSIYKYYTSQTGKGDVFRGELVQRGYGLGNIISGIVKYATPLIKSHVLPLARKGVNNLGSLALKSDKEILPDTLIKKQHVKKSIKRIANTRLDELLKSVDVKKQHGKDSQKSRKRVLKRMEDIFD